MNVQMLKQRLREKGLPTSGKKITLMERLLMSSTPCDDDTIFKNERAVCETSSNFETPNQQRYENRENETCDEVPEVTGNLDSEWDLLARERDLLNRERALLERERKAVCGKPIDSYRPVLSTRDVIEVLPEFNPTNVKSLSAEQWMKRVESLKEIFQIDERLLMFAIPTKLFTSAKLWFMSIQDQCDSFETFKCEFVKNFESKVNEVEIHDRLRNSIRRRDQPLLEYYYEMKMISAKANISKEALIKYIVLGINETNLQNSLRAQCIANIDELKERICWYNSMQPIRVKFESSPMAQNQYKNSTKENVEASSSASSFKNKVTNMNEPRRARQYDTIHCFNCGEEGHFSSKCSKPQRRERCGDCQRVHPKGSPINCQKTSLLTKNDVNIIQSDEFKTDVSIQFLNGTICEVNAIIDTGSPINIIKRRIVPESIQLEDNDGITYTGVNKAKIIIFGLLSLKCKINSNFYCIRFHVVADETMGFDCLIGREFLKDSRVSCNILTAFGNDSITICPSIEVEQATRKDLFSELLNVEYSSELDIDTKLDFKVGPIYHDIGKDNGIIQKFIALFEEFDNRPNKIIPDTKHELGIHLTSEKPIYALPKRLSIYDREQVREIIDDLLKRRVIRPSTSDYASRIVLVKKKNGKQRMCVDFRELNKVTIKERFPLPVIDDCIDKLRGKKVFSLIDLKNGFHHIAVKTDSIKYTAFVTPDGQFEYLKMPFGLSNAPSVFQRFVATIFKDLIDSGDVIIYIDDILIATDNIEEHFIILEKVFTLLYNNCLEIQPAKCSFFQSKIDYLGYEITEDEIRPTLQHIDAIENYPIPKNVHEMHRFIGMTSFFRRFIQNYSILAKPLYDLLKKDAIFKLNKIELDAFQLLKTKLTSSPTLSLYNPKAYTELHTDASQIGFGAILLQRQTDGHLHPVLFYSKRTSEAEGRYHSFELETLAIIYALQRFHVYVHGIHIKIVTDCNSLKMTLEKKNTNNRIMRWTLLLENYDYEIVHRMNNQMRHVDALSRAPHVLILECSLSRNLAHFQLTDKNIKEIYDNLTRDGESKWYELRENLVYRKYKTKLLFLVPDTFVNEIIRQYHSIGHVGVGKTVEMIKRNYWFTNMTERVNDFIKRCMKCLIYEPKAHREGFLHVYDKHDRPFHTIHVDHDGPFETTKKGYKYILAFVDGFTKYTRLYPTKTTSTNEVIRHMKNYFIQFSVPLRLVSDRGSCFTSKGFKDFVDEIGIQHVLTATSSPQSNGQVERGNRTLKPIISKMVELNTSKWDSVLSDTEFVINNTLNRTIGTTPSIALFGVNQVKKNNTLDLFIESQNEENIRDLNKIRNDIEKNTVTNQEKYKIYFDKKRIDAFKYKEGDYVFIKNTVTEPGINHKLLPKFKGPYMVTRVLPGERYVVEDVPGQMLSGRRFNGVFAAFNMKPCVLDEKQSESIAESDMAEL